MKLLPYWTLTGSNPAFYDTQSATAIEQTAKVYGAMQSLITEYNQFVINLNKEITDYENTTNRNIDEFKECITNIVSNYIQTVDMKISELEKHMKTNLEDTAQKMLNDAIKLGNITIVEEYNPATESLNLVVTGEV